LNALSVIGFIVTILNKSFLLPSEMSETYRSIIYRSMISRYENFMKRGDTVRGEAMKYFIEGFEARGFHCK
jgi:hypothetical protein